MKPFVSKSTAKLGVQLSTLSRSDNCDLELIVPNQYCTCKRNLIIKEYPFFNLKVRFTCKGGEYPKGIKLSFKNLPYPQDNGKIKTDKNSFITVELMGKDYSGTLIVYRRGYMSPDVLGKLRVHNKQK